MKRLAKWIQAWLLVLCFPAIVRAGDTLVVAQDGTGDFRTIQGAINSLPDTAATPRVLLVRKGVYKEKLYIQKHNLVIRGEDKHAVIIVQSVARDIWRCLHNDDWGVATVNIEANDITLENLTITNNWRFELQEEVETPCYTDTAHTSKRVGKYGHQMALRTFACTRLKVINCILKAFGGDTVSPWNVRDGMFYFKDCVMEGGVDFYCPRGWAWAENCVFYAHTGSAAIWHDGSVDPDSKTVLKNCRFDGFKGFNLGRFHRDAQFYLVDCFFSANMADRDIFQAPAPNPVRWGKRVYYANCRREGKDFAWYADNLASAPGSPQVKDITPAWVFKGRWNPEAE